MRWFFAAMIVIGASAQAQYLVYMPAGLATETWDSGAKKQTRKTQNIWMLNLGTGVGCGWSLNGKKFSEGGQADLTSIGTATGSHMVILMIRNEHDYSFLDGDLRSVTTKTLPTPATALVPYAIRLTAFDWEDGVNVQRYTGAGPLKLDATQYVNNGNPASLEAAKSRLQDWLISKGYRPE